MKTVIAKEKFSSILNPSDNKWYDTGVELDLDFSTSYKLSRVAKIEAKYDSIPYDPTLWSKNKFINFFGDIDTQSGFGNVSYYLLKESVGTLEIASMGKTYGVRDQAVFGCQQQALNQAGAMIWHDQPREQWLYSPFKKNIAIVPWETTKIPASWLTKINSFDAVLVPCKQNITDFKNSGVTIDIGLIHWGIDPNKFYPLQRPQKDIFTFGHMGALSYRKGTDLLIEAFEEAFPKTVKDVKLICKTSYNTYPYGRKDNRIEVLITPYTQDELLNIFFKNIDCFVFPTRGEGFGLTSLEALATGVPAIVTDWSGPTEFMTPKIGWAIDYKMTPAKNFTDFVYHEECGDWAEPSKEHLIELMRYAYNHRDEVKEKGKLAARYVKDNWLWSNKIKMFHKELNKYL